MSGEDRNQEDGKFSSIKFQNVIFLEEEKNRNAHGQSEYAHSTNPSNKMCNDKHRSGVQNKLHEQSACESSSTYNSSTSGIFQCDGADSISSTCSIHSEDTEYNTEDEALTEREPAVLVPAPQQPGPGQPLVLEVDETGMMVLPASLPHIMLTNARSLYNKIDNFTKWLLQIFPDCVIVSETFEHETRRVSLEQLLASSATGGKERGQEAAAQLSITLQSFWWRKLQ